MTEPELVTINLTVDLAPPATQEDVEPYVKALMNALFEVHAMDLVLNQRLRLAQEICDHGSGRWQGLMVRGGSSHGLEQCRACRKQFVRVEV